MWRRRLGVERRSRRLISESLSSSSKEERRRLFAPRAGADGGGGGVEEMAAGGGVGRGEAGRATLALRGRGERRGALTGSGLWRR